MDSRLDSAVRLSASVWRLGTFHLPCFLIKGKDGCALFEVGVSATAPVVLEQLKQLGVEYGRIKWVILSHAHSDHATGQAGLMAALDSAALLLSSASAEDLATSSTAAEFAQEDAFTSAAVRRLMGQNHDAPPSSAADLLPKPWQTVEAGQSLDVGGLKIEFLGAEGHVLGGLLAWLPAEGVLLASDSAGFCASGRPGFPLYFISYPDYFENIKALRALNPKVLALGHQNWFTGEDVGRYLDSLLRHLENEHQETLSRAAAGETLKAQARRVLERYYQGELAIYPEKAMAEACRYLVKRDLEA